MNHHDHDGNLLAPRQRVTYIRITGTANVSGRVSRTLKSAVRVRFDDGRVEDVYPHDLRRSARAAGEENRNSSFVPNTPESWDRSSRMGQE